MFKEKKHEWRFIVLFFYLLFGKSYKRPLRLSAHVKKPKSLISIQGASSEHYGKKINKFKNFVFKNEILRYVWFQHVKVYKSLILF